MNASARRTTKKTTAAPAAKTADKPTPAPRPTILPAKETKPAVGAIVSYPTEHGYRYGRVVRHDEDGVLDVEQLDMVAVHRDNVTEV